MGPEPTPRQARILRRLELIGPGSVAFFRDYTKIASQPECLESYSHLVAHLFREIESSIRDVIESISPKYEKKGRDDHRRSVEVCLQGLEVDPDDPIAASWMSFCGDENLALHKVAHRNGLQLARGEIQTSFLLWSAFEELIENVLTKYEGKYLAVVSQLDAIVEKMSPGVKDAKKLVGKMPQHWTIQKYFFERVQNPVWLDLLYEENFFANPPAKKLAPTGENYEPPPWPASKFLIKMALLVPASVAQVIESIPAVNNRNVCNDIVRACLLLPDENILAVRTSLESWFSKCEHIAIHDDYAELVMRYLGIGAIHEALTLIDQLLSVRAVRNAGEPDFRFDEWSLEHFLEKVVPAVARVGDVQALDLFACLLNDSFTVSGSEQRLRRLFGASSLPAIEDHAQNQEHIDHQCRLIFAIRDIAIALATLHWANMIACLRRFDDGVFMRIELLLRSEFPEQDPEGTAELICKNEILTKSEFHHERFHLLRNCFGALPISAKEYYLHFVEDETRLAAIREKRDDISDDEWPRLKKRLIYDRLIPIAQYLEGEWRSLYDAYLVEFGEEPHPDLLFYMEGGRLINRVTTRSLEEFTDCSAEEFAERIRALEAASDSRVESKSELANTLQDLVTARTSEFATAAQCFSDLPPMYTRSFLRSIRDYLETRRPLESNAWRSVLKLCDAEVQQYRTVVEDRESYRETYIHLRTIISILQSGVRQEGVQLPIELRELLWKVLQPLSDHSDPQVDEEDANEDMATKSINSVRGEAMHAVVDYAWWVRRSLDNDFNGMVTVPEVRDVLEKHLTEDKSLTICAVYGKWYPWLETIDESWAREWKDRIFPESDERRRRVAWETYVTFCPPYNGIFESLNADYAWAVTQIGKWPPDRRWSMGHPDESLLEHLFAYYWRGKLPLDDQEISLREAYQKAQDENKVEALRDMGRGIKEWVSVDAETLERLKKLWKDLVKANGGPKALETFSLWFSSGKFDDSWSLAELQHVLDVARPIRPEHWVIERLAQLAPEHPGETLGCLSSVYDSPEAPMYLEHWWEQVMSILRAALVSEDKAVRTKAIGLANTIGAKGLQPEHLKDLRTLVADDGIK